MERLLKEANELADQGVRELILVAQETTLYGVDLYGKKMLPELLHKLAEITAFTGSGFSTAIRRRSPMN